MHLNTQRVEKGTYSIGVVIDKEPLFVVHGLYGHIVLQVFGEKPFVDHVMVEGVVKLSGSAAQQRSFQCLHF